jgi:hypothetical protein
VAPGYHATLSPSEGPKVQVTKATAVLLQKHIHPTVKSTPRSFSLGADELVDVIWDEDEMAYPLVVLDTYRFELIRLHDAMR